MPGKTIESVTSACALLDELARSFEPRRMADLAAALNAAGHAWSNTKLYELLQTLVAAGYAECTRDGRYYLGTAYTRAAAAYVRHLTERAEHLRRQVAEITQDLERIPNP